jgi:hypothetical protein
MRRLRFGLLLLPAFLAAASAPPVHETVELAAITLNRLVLRPLPPREPGLLPSKTEWLPASVALYLKPSGQLNHHNAAVQKAAAQVRRAVAPAAAQKARLQDSAQMAAGVRAWLDEHLPLDPSVDWGSRPATDHRLAWPRASAILAQGRADADGRALAAVAILRALKVPARVATARGRLVCQYWQPRREETAAERKARGKQGPKPPLGWWAVLDPGLHEAEIDAWSLDSGVLARMHWSPAQELSIAAEDWERAVFPAEESATARAAFEASRSLGRLTATAGAARELGPVAEAVLDGLTRGTRTLYVLTVQRFRLGVDGAMASMDPVDILGPYRPHLASWGRELNGCVQEMEIEAQALWTDRPGRLRLRSNGLPRDEWKSPPPALGVLHYLSCGLRRFGSVLQAQRNGAEIEGVLLRADNLSPRAGWTLHVVPRGVTESVQSLTVGADGRFRLTLNEEAAQADWVELRTPEEGGMNWRGDRQLLRRVEYVQK